MFCGLKQLFFLKAGYPENEPTFNFTTRFSPAL